VSLAAASSKDVAKAAASSKDVAKAAASSRDVSKAAASSRDVSKAAKPAPPPPKYTEPDLGTYRTRPPPPLPRIASQPPPAPSPPPVRPPMPPAKGYQPIVNIQPFPRSTEPLNLSVGDKAVHPLHGLGEVSSIEHREVGGVSGDFYILRILDKGMRVMVPKASATSSGLRAVMSEKDANAVLDTLRAKEVAVDLQPWSRRFRAYTEMMKSGSPHEVAKVLRDMFRLKFDKDLSFGERRLLDQAKSLLMKELAAAKKISEADLLAEVSEMFKA
jgi:CarD family transcriptional regulator